MINFYKNFISYLKNIFIYLFLTLVLLIAIIVRNEFFDSIAHSFTTISTGGFSTHDASFAYFENYNILFVAIVFMVLGSLPFLVLAQTKS